MGSEIHKSVYTEEDYVTFEKAWLAELEFVKGLFAKGSALFSDAYRLGYELEACILDESNQPAPCNKAILEELNSSEFTNELANYDLEINGSVFDLDSATTVKLQEDLSALWQMADRAARKFHTRLGLFGVFPNLKPEHFDRERYQSQMMRYTMASQRIHELRHESIKLLFAGEDIVSLQRNDVMSEALSTSLQIHFQVPFEKSAAYYHAALLASVIMVGVGANSPLVMGKRAWHESRIPIFEQSVDARDKERREHGDEKRVHFAHGYIDSWLDLFEQNREFKILFPEVIEEKREKLHHFNLHNGTIWRWIRPIISQDREGKWTLRLELRILPAGPTLVDMEANIWFFIGIMEGLVSSGSDLTKIPFEQLKKDFYRVAKAGLESRFHEPLQGKECDLHEWILSEGMPLAGNGLNTLNVKDTERYLEIIRLRVKRQQNGAIWQLRHFEKYQSIEKLVKEYMNHFEHNIPIHEWSL